MIFFIVFFLLLGFFLGIKLSFWLGMLAIVVAGFLAHIWGSDKELGIVIYYLAVILFAIGIGLGDTYKMVKYPTIRQQAKTSISSCVDWLFTPSFVETNNIVEKK